MGYSVVKINGMPTSTQLVEYIIDSESDISSLPTGAADGSTAYTKDLSKIYLFKNGSWTEVEDGPSDAQIKQAVDDWLDAHPEATTTVEDGAINYAKLDNELKAKADDVVELKSQIGVLEPTATSEDVGKALIAKTVSDGKVTEYEFGEAGGVDPEVIEQAVTDWLDNHPEATTTVQDWSLSYQKLIKGTTGFVTPEMFGAVGDGETDDTDAIRDALDYAIAHGCELKFGQKTYIVTPKYDSGDYCAYSGVWHCGYIGANESVVIDLNNATLKIGLNSKQAITIFFGFFADGVVIKNGNLIGDLNNESYGTGDSYDSSKLVYLYDCTNCHIINVRFSESKGDAVGVVGKEKTQQTVPGVIFRDVYSNITMHDCSIINCQRDGITITKGRGLFFENIYMDTLGPLNGGIGVDVEPYYGLGSVFDIRFSGCTIRNATNGLYFQSCENVIVDSCNTLKISTRVANNIFIGNNNCGAESIAIAGANAVIVGNVAGSITVDPSRLQSVGDIDKIIRISNNTVSDGIECISTDSENRIQYRLLEISGNTIAKKTRHGVSIGTSGKPSNYDKAIISNNTIERYGDGNYRNIIVYAAKDVDIMGNVLLYDADNTSSETIEIVNVTDGCYTIINNLISFPSIRYTRTSFRNSFLGLTNCTNFTALIKGNIYNPQRIPKSAYGTDNWFIKYTNLSSSRLSIVDNYCYGVVTFVTAVADIILCVRNIVQDVDYTYTPPAS